ncbi:MAG TPA: hypothetical protein VFW71_02625 [Actinomycetota bacterium]|nr:hypothetical protein [Actinomycetota bacterium]
MRWLLVAGAVALVAALSFVLLRAPSGLDRRYGPDGVVLGSPQPAEGDPAPPGPSPCPTLAPTKPAPSTIACGPAAGPGNGTGADGVCTGAETAPPCGPGAVPGTYYAYSLPLRCDGLVVFDGKVWKSELPPPFAGPTEDVWMALTPGGGGVGFISVRGDVGFTLESASPSLPPAPPCPATP